MAGKRLTEQQHRVLDTMAWARVRKVRDQVDEQLRKALKVKHAETRKTKEFRELARLRAQLEAKEKTFTDKYGVSVFWDKGELKFWFEAGKYYETLKTTMRAPVVELEAQVHQFLQEAYFFGAEDVVKRLDKLFETK